MEIESLFVVWEKMEISKVGEWWIFVVIIAVDFVLVEFIL